MRILIHKLIFKCKQIVFARANHEASWERCSANLQFAGPPNHERNPINGVFKGFKVIMIKKLEKLEVRIAI